MAQQDMRYAKRSSWKFSHALVMFFITGIMSMGLLSMMRGDSQALDRRLTALQDRLSLCEKEIRDLEREAAAMMSPRQVHAYALKELGMTQVHLAGAIRIDGIGNADLTATAQLLGKGRVYTNN